MFCGLSEDKMAVNQDMFWTYSTDFNSNNGSFDGDGFIWKSKENRDDNSHLWHKNIHFLSPRLLVL